MSSPACIAVAGFDSVWGSDLCERLKAGAPEARILELDGDPVSEDRQSVDGIPVGWSEADSEEKLAEVLIRNAVEVLAYRGSPDLPIREEEMDDLGPDRGEQDQIQESEGELESDQAL